MFETPITSIEQAKEYYRAMGCSHFHMAREYPNRYEEYQKLNISKQKETLWKTEQLDEYYNDVVENKTDMELWIIHSRISELVESLKTEIAIRKILEVTEYIRDRVPMRDRVIVSETINGRGIRSIRRGLIYLAYDLKRIDLAKAFVELSLHFSTITKNCRDSTRCKQATELCNDIKLELRL